jgi:Fur family zinc uptake transcriptional regulator
MPPAVDAAAFLDRGHDHAHCLEDALDRAAQVCRTRGVRLTPLRRRVLELVWSGHKPLGAYEILDVLRAERSGAAPPTVYRALDFLREHGLVHRIESRNSFVGCADPVTPHAGQFLICRSCGLAAELNDQAIDAAIRKSAAKAGFAIGRRTVEIEGVCPNCRND